MSILGRSFKDRFVFQIPEEKSRSTRRLRAPSSVQAEAIKDALGSIELDSAGVDDGEIGKFLLYIVYLDSLGFPYNQVDPFLAFTGDLYFIRQTITK